MKVFKFFHTTHQQFLGGHGALLKATPLALCAIGLAVGFRAGIWNIGAEGQFILGAIFATAVALHFGDWPVISLLAMMIAGALGE